VVLGFSAVTRGAAPNVDDARLEHAEKEPQNWLAHGGSHTDWYYSPLEQINTANVGRLAPAWVFDFDTQRGQESTPLVVDGILFTTTAWNKVFAIDARTGKQLWEFDPQVPGPSGYKSCCDVVNRGPAVYLDKVYISTIDGRLIALNAHTGRSVWSVQTLDPAQMSAITGAPRVIRGKVIIGNGGGETGGRGYVTAYDAQTGKLVWRFYTVPDDPAKGPDHAASDEVLERIARPTWPKHSYEAGGGGQVWNAITVDPRLGRIYIGTANPYPWNPQFRSQHGGDALFTDCIVALDADTGHYLWHYQEVPGDAWDYDAAEDMILTDLPIQGEKRPVLMQAAKDGYFYVLDRETGRLVSAQPFVKEVTWSHGIDHSTGRPIVDAKADYAQGPFIVSPGPSGAHSWRPTAYNPSTGLVYIPTSETTFRYVGAAPHPLQKGIDDIGVVKGGPLLAQLSNTNTAPLPPSREYLLAWDPVAKRSAWQAESTGGGGVLTTAGNLVFQGEHRRDTAGELTAYRADTGQKLWTYRTPNAILTGPVSFSVDGTQYIAVVAGAGGSADLLSRGPDQTLMPGNGRLLAFKLDGTAKLPEDAGPAPSPLTVTNTGSPEAVREGGILFAQYCSRCHGREAQSHNVVPDLRRSAALADSALWKTIVIDGALSPAGMISWRQYLSSQQAESIREYVTSQAQGLRRQP
jgi:quinohemoprotein ethanol dehydrogenase